MGFCKPDGDGWEGGGIFKKGTTSTPLKGLAPVAGDSGLGTNNEVLLSETCRTNSKYEVGDVIQDEILVT